MCASITVTIKMMCIINVVGFYFSGTSQGQTQQIFLGEARVHTVRSVGVVCLSCPV